MTVYVGTSGWQYRDWRGTFYPERMAAGAWLDHYVSRFRTVEVNNTFYRLPPATTFAGWARRLPEDFVMVLKLSRYLTHVKRLKDPEEPVRRFLDRAAPLGARMGPLLLQLPPNLHADVGRLEAVLDLFPKTVRVAVEFRHDSWFTDDARSALEARNAALCLVDRKASVLGPVWRTADWGYVRFHEGDGSPRPCYRRASLVSWAERIAGLWSGGEDVFAFFNNDPRACAVRDAGTFAACVSEAGLEPTRVPGEGEVRVAR